MVSKCMIDRAIAVSGIVERMGEKESMRRSNLNSLLSSSSFLQALTATLIGRFVRSTPYPPLVLVLTAVCLVMMSAVVPSRNVRMRGYVQCGTMRWWRGVASLTHSACRLLPSPPDSANTYNLEVDEEVDKTLLNSAQQHDDAEGGCCRCVMHSTSRFLSSASFAWLMLLAMILTIGLQMHERRAILASHERRVNQLEGLMKGIIDKKNSLENDLSTLRDPLPPPSPADWPYLQQQQNPNVTTPICYPYLAGWENIRTCEMPPLPPILSITRMDIVMSVSGREGRYLEELVTNLKSWTLHRPEGLHLEFHLLVDNVTFVQMYLESVLHRWPQQPRLSFIDVPAEMEAHNLTAATSSWREFKAGASFRLFLPWIMEDTSIDRIVYVDLDSLVISDPRELYRHFTRFGPAHIIGAVWESYGTHAGWYAWKVGEKQFPWPHPHGINSGMLLIRLDRLRLVRDEFFAHMHDAFGQYGKYFQLGDQDLLNYLFASWKVPQLLSETDRRANASSSAGAFLPAGCNYHFTFSSRVTPILASTINPTFSLTGPLVVIHGNAGSFHGGDLHPLALKIYPVYRDWPGWPSSP